MISTISTRTVFSDTQQQINDTPARVREGMDGIKVKNESLPTRCETCHKADCFDPQTNICSRCSNIEDEEVTTKPVKKKLTLDYGDVGLIIGAVSGVLMGIVIGLLHQELKNDSLAISTIFWLSTGLSLLDAVLGAAIGESIKQYRKHNRK